MAYHQTRHPLVKTCKTTVTCSQCTNCGRSLQLFHTSLLHVQRSSDLFSCNPQRFCPSLNGGSRKGEIQCHIIQYFRFMVIVTSSILAGFTCHGPNQTTVLVHLELSLRQLEEIYHLSARHRNSSILLLFNSSLRSWSKLISISLITRSQSGKWVSDMKSRISKQELVLA